MGIKSEISKLHYDKTGKSLILLPLKFCSIFYAAGSGLKNFLYEKGIIKPQKVGAFVISVGNLTTGGVGKTPYVAELTKKLLIEGKKPAIVSRGYGGNLKGVNIISDGKQVFFTAKEAGDEPVWLSKNTSVPVITSHIRFEGAECAIEKFGADTIILDDGFQHRKLHRDINILLIDSEKQFGNKLQLPAGPLRESLKEIKRADKIVVVSKNTEHTKAIQYVRQLREQTQKQVSLCKIEPDFAYNINDEKDILPSGNRACAFCAIGQPEQFYKFLDDFKILKTVDFDDHHIYTKNDFKNFDKDIPLITTEKDAVKCKLLKTEQKIYALKLKTIEEENIL